MLKQLGPLTETLQVALNRVGFIGPLTFYLFEGSLLAWGGGGKVREIMLAFREKNELGPLLSD